MRNGNPYNIKQHVAVKHGAAALEGNLRGDLLNQTAILNQQQNAARRLTPTGASSAARDRHAAAAAGDRLSREYVLSDSVAQRARAVT
jgi:hypothetical protein